MGTKVIVVLSMCVILGSATDAFCIGSYGGENIDDLIKAESLGLNTIIGPSKNSVQKVKDYLEKAYDTNLKVLLSLAPGPEEERERRLTHYAEFWHMIWEVEDEEFFEHDVGEAVDDPDAQNHTAWKCTENDEAPGVMLTGWDGPRDYQLRIPVPEYPQFHNGHYKIWFRLKIVENDQNTDTRVCSLGVRNVTMEEVKLCTLLYMSDFEQQGEYQMFTFNDNLELENGSRPLIYYEIYWYGNCDLWADHVEIYDDYIPLLTEGFYDDTLDAIVAQYPRTSYPSLLRYYLRDEPAYGHFEASAYVIDYLTNKTPCDPSIPGFATSGAGSMNLGDFADSLDYPELCFDWYPFRDWVLEDGIDESSFQSQLSKLCGYLAEMRLVALEHDKYFYFCTQAFGIYGPGEYIRDPDVGGTAYPYRLPTPREMRCNVWLGLSYGARGMLYFRFMTRKTGEGTDKWENEYNWMRGLLRWDGQHREPQWSEALELNTMLEEIGPLLMSLTSDTCFFHSSPNDPMHPNCCGITNVDLYPVQIGTFTDDEYDYFVIVNRDCRVGGETYYAHVAIEYPLPLMYIHDCYSGENVGPEDTPPPYVFNISLRAGEGRLFRLVPSDRTGGPQSIASNQFLCTAIGSSTPQPFRRETSIAYSVAKRLHVSLNVYNVSGQLVQTLVNRIHKPGHYSIDWHVDEEQYGYLLPNGIYFLQFKAGDVVEVRKMVLVR